MDSSCSEAILCFMTTRELCHTWLSYGDKCRVDEAKADHNAAGISFSALEQCDCCQSVPASVKTNTPPTAYELLATCGSKPFILCHVQHSSVSVKVGSQRIIKSFYSSINGNITINRIIKFYRIGQTSKKHKKIKL